MSTRRTFNLSQRRTLFDQADGMCCECGQPLPESWHADHVVPFSRGGSTTVSNGQALCPPCNLRKGATVVSNKNQEQKPRPWQARALGRINELYGLGQRNFLVVACPGAGKTYVAIEMLKRYALAENRLVIVVVPSKSLRNQWVKKLGAFAHADELDTKTDQVNTTIFVTTYKGLDSQKDQLLASMRRKRREYVVVFDEVHHNSESNKSDNGNVWGAAVNAVFKNNTSVHATLSLSGTPFRADGLPIVFLKYNAEGNVIPDYEYTYQEALNDDAVREVRFFDQAGIVEWQHGETTYRHSTADDVDKKTEGQRYGNAIKSESQLVERMCTVALANLKDMRNEDKDAGMIVFAHDQKAAEKLRIWFQSRVKDQVALVTSQEDDGDQQLQTFIKGTNSIIVCIDKIGEGVDIPRLRVAVYLRRVRDSESKLWQYLGRILRVPEDELEAIEEAKKPPHQDAVEDVRREAQWYSVFDPKLRDWSINIRQMVNVVIEDREKGQGPPPPPGQGTTLLTTEAQGEEVYLAPNAGRIVSQFMTDYCSNDMWVRIESTAKQMSQITGQRWADHALELLRKNAARTGVVLPEELNAETLAVSQTNNYEQRQQLRKTVHRLASHYGNTLTAAHGVARHDFVWLRLEEIDGQKHKDCTSEHYKNRIKILKTWIAAGGRHHEL